MPLLVIIASSILIIVDFITSEEIDDGFWIRLFSIVLIMLSMVLTIRERKKLGQKRS